MGSILSASTVRMELGKYSIKSLRIYLELDHA